MEDPNQTAPETAPSASPPEPSAAPELAAVADAPAPSAGQAQLHPTGSALPPEELERLTGDIVAAIDESLKPRGIAVMIEAEHQCMTLRGVRAHGAATVTTQFTGVFRDEPAEQIRFMTLVKGGHQGG